VRSLWLRVRGRYSRFGAAAVRFGTPLSLHGFTGDVTDLARELMGRIRHNMPALSVPLVALAFERAGGALSRDGLEAAVARYQSALPAGQVPTAETAADIVDQGLNGLFARGVVVSDTKGLRPAEADMALVSFYAASVAHLVPEEDVP
jgi:glycerol-3-phosphate O-acyltransferase